MKLILVIIMASLFSSAPAYNQNPTLTGLADNTLSLVENSGDCGSLTYCRSGSSCQTCCENGILAFGSMVYDFHRHKIYTFGGGHATSCFPSNVAEFDFSTLKWTYAINIDSLGSCAALYATANLLKDGGGSYLGGFTYGGKKYAGSRHTYDGLLMAPDTALMICAEGMDFEGCDGLTGPDYRQGSGLWILDPAARAWSVSASAGLGVIYCYSAADPEQPDYYFVGGGISCNEFYKVNWRTGQKTSRAVPPVCDVDMSMEYYPVRKTLLAFPTTNLAEYDIARNAWTRLSPAGTAPNGYSLSVVYDTLNRVFCTFYNNDFYYYSPLENRWRSMGQNFSMARLHHHHVYDPVNNVHIMLDLNWKTYAYKFSDTPGKYPGTGLGTEARRYAKDGSGMLVTPNPVTQGASIRLKGPLAKGYNLSLFNLQGKRMADLTDRVKDEALAWNAGRLAPGVYVLRLLNNGRISEKRLALLR